MRFKNVALYPSYWRYIQTILRSTNDKAHVQKQALPFVSARYIRIFDGKSEVI